MRNFLITRAALIWCSLVLVAASNPEGTAFLKENAQKDGVVVLPSGLQYRVIKKGPEGGRRPLTNSPCKCHYRGTLINGVEFDSSYKRGQPTTFAPNQVVGMLRGPFIFTHGKVIWLMERVNSGCERMDRSHAAHERRR